MKDIKVSAVTVCYNSVKTIEQTIKSVLGQSYKNIEYIVIDGASTDGTVDIIRKYEKDIDCWISEPDNGIYDAMNKGIVQATGDIIGFINSDDWYAENALSSMAEAFSSTDADIVYGKTWIVDHGGYCFLPNGNLEDMCFGLTFGHPSTYVRIDYLKKYMFDCSYKIAADYAFLLKMYLQGKKFHSIDVPIAYFRVGGCSSHPWKAYCETKRVALRLSKGKVSDERYREIRAHYKSVRKEPILSYLSNRFASGKKPIQVEKQDFIIYGAGKIGRQLFDIMRLFKMHVRAFWDSDPIKQGSVVDDLPVLCPDCRSKQTENVLILIATIKDNEEIVAKLISLGYQKEKNFFTMEAWLGYLAKEWVSGK